LQIEPESRQPSEVPSPRVQLPKLPSPHVSSSQPDRHQSQQNPNQNQNQIQTRQQSQPQSPAQVQTFIKKESLWLRQFLEQEKKDELSNPQLAANPTPQSHIPYHQEQNLNNLLYSSSSTTTTTTTLLNPAFHFNARHSADTLQAFSQRTASSISRLPSFDQPTSGGDYGYISVSSDNLQLPQFQNLQDHNFLITQDDNNSSGESLTWDLESLFAVCLPEGVANNNSSCNDNNNNHHNCTNTNSTTSISCKAPENQLPADCALAKAELKLESDEAVICKLMKTVYCSCIQKIAITSV